MAITVKWDLRGMDKFVAEFPAMHHRLSNWTPIEKKLHQVLLTDYRKMYSTRRGKIGDMGNLGPSFTNASHAKHRWQFGKTWIEFGTDVHYSQFYESWRKGNGRRSHIQIRARAKRALTAQIMDWVVDG